MPVLAIDYAPSTSCCEESNATAIDLDELCWLLDSMDQ